MFHFWLGQSFATGLLCMPRFTHHSSFSYISITLPINYFASWMQRCWCCPSSRGLICTTLHVTEPSVMPLSYVVPSFCRVNLLPGIPNLFLYFTLGLITGLHI